MLQLLLIFCEVEFGDWDAIFGADGFGFGFQKRFSAFFFGLVDDFCGLVHGLFFLWRVCVFHVLGFKNGLLGLGFSSCFGVFVFVLNILTVLM